MRGPDEPSTDRARELRRTQTDVERKLWHRLSNRQLAGCKFARQEPIGPYIADFACRERRLVVELDGSQHADSERDRVRDSYLTERGFRVLRFWNGAVNRELPSVLDTIYAALEERTPAPSPRLRGEVERRGTRRPGEGASTPSLHVDAPSPGRADARLDLSPQAGRGGRAPAAKLVLLGEFGRAHGLAGEVRLKSYTADPLAIAGYGPLLTPDGRRLTLRHVRPAAGAAPDLLVARVEGVASREGAEALNRTRLHVERDRLSPPEDDEYLLADLIGLPAFTTAGAVFGRVLAIPNYGGGELLEIAPAAGGPTILLPFTKAFVPEVDLAAGRIVVDPPDDVEGEQP